MGVCSLTDLVIPIQDKGLLSIMLRLRVTLGVFPLLAVRDPAAHRSLILFAELFAPVWK
jgi:hypothetical protein